MQEYECFYKMYLFSFFILSCCSTLLFLFVLCLFENKNYIINMMLLMSENIHE